MAIHYSAAEFQAAVPVELHTAVPAEASATPGKRYLLGPLADFLCFGGSSLIILPLLLLIPAEANRAGLAFAMMLAANVINHPHFAHSYQLFYRGFTTKAFTPALGRVMQTRYLVAGVIAPIVLIGFFMFAIAGEHLRLLGLAGNAMGFFVGWHYVKQGYGLMMVDCALKRQFFNDEEKRLLLVNGYAVWIASWMQFNAVMAKSSMWGIAYFTFAMPSWLVTIALLAALVSTAMTGWMLLARWRAKGALPVNGVIAYTVSLYPWLLLIKLNPLWALVVPALHSLQYLAVVWRFQFNYEHAKLGAPDYKTDSVVRRIFGSHPLGQIARFVLAGTVLGYAGFWFLPTLLGTMIPHDETLFGATLFLFVGWVFINIHHYFMDNVMWRRDNPDTKLYLFK